MPASRHAIPAPLLSGQSRYVDFPLSPLGEGWGGGIRTEEEIPFRCPRPAPAPSQRREGDSAIALLLLSFLALNPAQACDAPAGSFRADDCNGRDLTGSPLLTTSEAALGHTGWDGSPGANVPVDLFPARGRGRSSFGGNAKPPAGWTLQALSGPRPQAPIGSNASSTVGTNLGDWNDYSTEQPFLDAFKTSRAWITQAPGVWDTNEEAALDLDANGWVRSLPAAADTTRRYRSVTTLMLNGASLDGVRQGGEYIVLYDGEGTLAYGLGARKNDAASRPGRDVIAVDKNNSGGIQLTLAATDPHHTGNYLRNIRVVASGLVCDDDPLAYCLAATDTACQRTACRTTEAALPDRLFHPAFLRTLVYYKALRFMNPMGANVIDNALPQPSQWSDRATPSKARWNGQPGVPAEVVAALSNQMRADPWVNMPHRATDDYIRQFARLTRATLAADRMVYVEYGNEIWNTAFSAGTWVEQQGMAAWPDTPDSPYTKRINWYGKRTAEMCDLWKSEWAGAENRVVCVLAAQAANPWTATAALDCELWSQAPCQNHGIGAVAMAPYFGHYLGYFENADSVDDWFGDADGGLSKLFAELQAGGQIAGGPQGGALALANQWTTAYARLARQRGLKLLAYEGGQHLVGAGGQLNNQNLTNLFVAANRDARMGAAYSRLLQGWKTAGGDLFMHFMSAGQPGRYGSWGALENMWQPGSPKSEALIRFILANPAN